MILKMEKITAFFKSILNTQILNSIVVITVSILLYKIVSYILGKGEKKNNFRVFTGKRGKTYLKLIRSLIRYIFILVTTLVLLQINGIDVSSALAGVGILGAIFGLAIQDWLKDIIRGSSILSDNYFSVGDIVKYKDIEGRVLVIGLKSTKIQELRTGYIKSIANRNIEEIDLVSNLIYINVPMPYELDIKRAEKVVGKIVSNIKRNNNVTDCRYLGVNDLAESSVKYCLEVACDQQYKLQVRRDALRSVLLEMEKNSIKVPYNQIDVHQK